MTTELYTLLKVKSRDHLGLIEWVWLKLHKKPTHDDYTKMLSDFRYSKCIEEEEWEVDEQGREVIPGLADKRFFLTDFGKKRLKNLKWQYLWNQVCRCVRCLIWLILKAWWIIAAVAALLANYLQLLQSLEPKVQ